jgi:hypothetical protein
VKAIACEKYPTRPSVHVLSINKDRDSLRQLNSQRKPHQFPTPEGEVNGGEDFLFLYANGRLVSGVVRHTQAAV